MEDGGVVVQDLERRRRRRMRRKMLDWRRRRVSWTGTSGVLSKDGELELGTTRSFFPMVSWAAGLTGPSGCLVLAGRQDEEGACMHRPRPSAIEEGSCLS
jgi:hypothetical protein